MPTLLSRTFALLNSTKHPVDQNLNNRTLQHEQSDSGPSQHISIELENTMSIPTISVWTAAKRGDRAALEYHIENSKIDTATMLNTRDPESDCTLLHLAISHAKENKASLLPILRLLLENNADVTVPNVYNVQAIHMVPLHCPDQPMACLDLLLDHKACVNARDGDGWTPLHYAARFCQPPDTVVHLLVSRGADINLRDVGHKTPLFSLLASGDHLHVFDWLLHTAKADLSLLGNFIDPVSRETQSCSIVLQAVKYNRPCCLELLINSKHALSQLSKVVTHDEIAFAHRFAKNHLDIKLLLEELEDLLERHPLSILNPHLRMTNSDRKPSIKTVLGLVRHVSHENSLFKMASKIIRRTQSGEH